MGGESQNNTTRHSLEWFKENELKFGLNKLNKSEKDISLSIQEDVNSVVYFN